jgi:hypothetical protein
MFYLLSIVARKKVELHRSSNAHFCAIMRITTPISFLSLFGLIVVDTFDAGRFEPGTTKAGLSAQAGLTYGASVLS